MRRNKRLAAMLLTGAMAICAPEAGYGAGLSLGGGSTSSPFVGSTAEEMARELEAQNGGAEAGNDGTGPAVDDGIGAPPYKETEISRELLEDNLLEYREISSRIENYNVTYRNTKSQIVGAALSLDAAREMSAEASELMEEARDLRDDDMDEETRALYESYKDAVQELRKQAQSATNADLPSSLERNLRQAKRNLTKAVENLLIQYQMTEAKAAVAEKNTEMSRAMLESRQRMAGLGMASQEEVLAAQESLLTAESGMQQAKAGLQNMRQNILVLLGWDHDAQITFAPVGSPDLSRLESMDPEADKKAAIGANTDLFSIRSVSASGSSSRAVKKRNVAFTEQTVAAQMERLYAEVQSKKQAYDAACSEFAAAEQTKAAADRQYSLGMMGRLEYLGAELSYLNASASHTSASLELFQAMENYDWAVHGLITGSEG